MRPLFLLLVVFPLLELWLLIRLGGQIGSLNTLLYIVVTAMVGSFLLRNQGLGALRRAQEKMHQGALPLRSLFGGLLLSLGGFLLLLPGIITDGLGLCFTVAGLLQWLLAALLGEKSASLHGQGTYGPGAHKQTHYQNEFHSRQYGARSEQASEGDMSEGDVIEGDFTVEGGSSEKDAIDQPKSEQ